MPVRPRGYCTRPGCPHKYPCPDHREERASSQERGYGGKRWASARRTCLRKDPFCTCDLVKCDHEPGKCGRLSVVADHDPKERVDLIAEGAPDPDAPEHLRGKCVSCHSRKTNQTRPNGWAGNGQ
jgi:5-methylcytosine-specific restriction enzyme A